MQLLNKYNAIDVTKLVMAFLVIGIHVGAIFEIDYPLLLNFILSTAVPFFFICSGFFIQSKIIKSGNRLYTLKECCKKYFKLYIKWHVVYFPIALKYFWFNERDLVGDLVYCIHMFVFVGEIIFSWPLWYLQGLIVAIIFIYLLQRCKLSLTIIWLISIFLMLIGFFIQIVTTSPSSYNNILATICQSSVDLWGTPDRNGPFRGFALVSTGMIIRQNYKCISHEYVLGTICVFISWLLFTFSLPLHLLFSGGGVFILASSIKLKNITFYSNCRIHSTLIYFMHMYFVVMCHMLFKNTITNIRMVFVAWLFIFCINWALAIAIEKLRRFEKYKWLNKFIG